ncbi:MAG: methyltransferase domain-containing protein [Chloroflexota bacterium]
MISPSQSAAVSLRDILACPRCKGSLEGPTESLRCVACNINYDAANGIPRLFVSEEMGETTDRQQGLYDEVAHEYDDVFSPHVANHYLERRTEVVRGLIREGLVLDVGAGTGALAEWVTNAGYTVVAADASTGMLAQASARGLLGGAGCFANALPFADNTFHLAYSVATMHHLETPERVAGTIAEMARVVRWGGFVLIWDHNPLNPYWPILMAKVPQDSGEERLVSMGELTTACRNAGLRVRSRKRAGLVPDFMPSGLMPLWTKIERLTEVAPGLNLLCAHNVVIAQKV